MKKTLLLALALTSLSLAGCTDDTAEAPPADTTVIDNSMEAPMADTTMMAPDTTMMEGSSMEGDAMEGSSMEGDAMADSTHM